MLDVATVLRATSARVLKPNGEGEWQEFHLSAADLERPLFGVSVDSRAVHPGGLFVALRGEHTDGHAFVGAAFAAGAHAAIVSTLPPTADGASPSSILFQVQDTERALQDLARTWRVEHDATVVGITGSIGKTTAKEIVASVVGARLPVHKSAANLNTEIGLPLELLRLANERVAVLEMGMHNPGDIGVLANIARPNIGIVTNVAPVHLERMGSIEAIAREKSRLISALPPTGLSILNGDDPWTRAMAATSGTARVALVGNSEECDYRAEDVQSLGLEGMTWVMRAEGRRIPLRSRVPGRHTILAFLAACAVARELGMSWVDIGEAVEAATLDVRQRLLRGPNDMLIIDDSYNAAPASMQAALDLLDAARGRKIAVLGDMLELGAGEEDAHRQIGVRAAESADWLVVCGPRSVWIADAAQQSGLDADHVKRTSTADEAIAAVRDIVRGASGDWAVLVKGSRGMKLEQVVAGLRGQA